MRYVTSIERLAKKDGYNEGKQDGLRQGQSQMLALQISHKFGSVPDWVEQRLLSANSEQLVAWSARLLNAKSVEDALAVQDQEAVGNHHSPSTNHQARRHADQILDGNRHTP